MNATGVEHEEKPNRVSMLVFAMGLLAVCVGSGSLAARRTATARKPPAHSAAAVPKATVEPNVRTKYGALPLSFEANEGQTDPSVQFISHGSGYTLFLRQTDALLALQSQRQTDVVQQKKDTKRKLFEASKLYRGTPRARKSKKTKTVSVTMEGANPNASVQPLDELPGKSNYFIGNDPKKWRTGIATFGRVKYAAVYPGIDLLYYGRQRQLEFDFVVAPGADPRTIGLKIEGDGQVLFTKSGNVRVRSGDESFELRHPEIFQMDGSKKQLVSGSFIQRSDHSIGFQIGAYDHDRQLIIDPTLAYSTYLGGNGTDDGFGIAVDSSGSAYVVGQTTSTNFPTLTGYTSASNASGIAFISKLNPTGTALLYSTYLGGTGGESGNGIALDPSGNVYVTGYTMSTDFPVVNGFQTSLAAANGDAFVSRIDTTQSGTASLTYSTYLGGGGNSAIPWGDYGEGIAVDASGLAYVTGFTSSDTSVAPFPTTSSAYQTSLLSEGGNAFLTVIDPSQSGAASLIYSTYLGGTSGPTQGDIGVGIAVDNSGDAYITGQTDASGSTPFPTTPNAYQTSLNTPYGNAFVTEISTTQSGATGLIYSTYLGGSGDSTYQVGDLGYAITLDSLGKVYVAGESCSTDFPLTSGAFETSNPFQGIGFVAKLDLTQSGTQGLLYSTFLGGTNGDAVAGISIDPNGNAIVAGDTFSIDFPTTSGALQTTRPSSASAGFLTQLNSTGTSLLYSTYLGGSCVWGDIASAVALDSNGNAYTTGFTCSTDFPTYPSNAYQTALGGAQNAFVTKFAFNANPGITASASLAPDSSGWNNSSVTVSFTCIPGGAPIQSCSSPAMVSTEGANQVISGTAEDTATNTATTSVTVNLDLTPPSLSITSPTNGASVSTPYVVVSGSVSDALSGVGRVFCNGAPAAVVGSAYSCTVQLNSASNSITVIATDLAGNSSTAAVNVSVGMSAPTSLQITPGPVTMIIGSNQTFAAIDQTGTRRPDATWSVSDTTIATLATDGSGTLTGVAAGQVTLTGAIGSVSAQTQVTVLAASSLTVGTPLWTAPAVSGFTAQKIVQAAPTANGPDLYSVETDSSGDLLIRAFKSDGSQLWQNVFADAFVVATALGDNSGGLIVEGTASANSTILDINAQTGNLNWQYPSQSNGFDSNLAVSPAGTVYFAETDTDVATQTDYTYLNVINGSTGALIRKIQLPVSNYTVVNQDGCQFNSSSNFGAAFGPPMVAPDGSAYLEIDSSQETLAYNPCSNDPVVVNSYAEALSLLQVLPDGGTQYQTLASYSLADVPTSGNDAGTVPAHLPGEVIPDGRGGILATWIDFPPQNPPYPSERLVMADVGSQGLTQAAFTGLDSQNAPFSKNLVLGDNNTAFFTDGAHVTAFDATTIQQNWIYASNGGTLSFVAATSGGGVLVNDASQGVIQLDSSGNASPPIASLQGTMPFRLGLPISVSEDGTVFDAWTGDSTGVMSKLAGSDALEAPSVYPQSSGGGSNGRGAVPTAKINVHYDAGTGNTLDKIKRPQDLDCGEIGYAVGLFDCQMAGIWQRNIEIQATVTDDASYWWVKQYEGHKGTINYLINGQLVPDPLYLTRDPDSPSLASVQNPPHQKLVFAIDAPGVWYFEDRPQNTRPADSASMTWNFWSAVCNVANICTPVKWHMNIVVNSGAASQPHGALNFNLSHAGLNYTPF